MTKKTENLIKLGDKVKDRVSGFEGIAVGVYTYLYGCRRIGVQPCTLKEDGSVKALHAFDEHQLVIIEPSVIEPALLPQATINLGDRVKDRLTGFDGIASGVFEFLGGIRNIAVQPEKIKKDNDLCDSETFDEGRLEVVKPKAFDNARSKKEPFSRTYENL